MPFNANYEILLFSNVQFNAPYRTKIKSVLLLVNYKLFMHINSKLFNFNMLKDLNVCILFQKRFFHK